MVKTLVGSRAAIPEGQRGEDERPGAGRRAVGPDRRAREEDGEARPDRRRRRPAGRRRRPRPSRSSPSTPRTPARTTTAASRPSRRRSSRRRSGNFLDLIQKYPEERELVDRARVYLTVCERQRRDPRPALTEPEDFYYAAVLEKNRGNVAEAIEHLKRAARKNGGGRVDFLLACCYAQQRRPRDRPRAPAEGDRGGPAPPGPRAARPRLRSGARDAGVSEAARVVSRRLSALSCQRNASILRG